MSDNAKFVQIAACATRGRQELHALDEDGNVWTYSSAAQQEAPFTTDWFWAPLETERRGSPAVVSGRSNE